MATNDEREEKARLDRRDFDLDTEEQDRQRKERDAQIIKVDHRSLLFFVMLNFIFKQRDETTTQNLIRLMKREVIKQQYWDSMAVKGRCIEVEQKQILHQNKRIFICIEYCQSKSKTSSTDCRRKLSVNSA